MSETKEKPIEVSTETPPTKPVKMTKKGVPDRRAETARANLKKANSVIKEAIQEIKNKKKKEVIYISSSEDEDEDDDVSDPILEIVPITKTKSAPIPIPVPDDTLKRYTDELEQMRKENSNLKNTIQKSYHRHLGVLNQEMLLKF